MSNGISPFSFEVCQKCAVRFSCPYGFLSKEVVEGRINKEYVFDRSVSNIGSGCLMVVMQGLSEDNVRSINLTTSSGSFEPCRAIVGVRDGAIEYFARMYCLGKLYKKQRWNNGSDNSVQD